MRLRVFAAGGTLAASGRLVDAYDPAVFQATFERFTGPTGAMFWLYPPPTALLAEPMAAVPYAPACAAWIVGGGALLTLALARRGGGGAVATSLSWPGTVLALFYGQPTPGLTAVLAEGLRLAGPRPWLGGALLGLLIWKPHWLVIPALMLVLEGSWRPLVGAALTGAALVAASTLRYGTGAWAAFFAASGTALARVRDMGAEDVVSTYAVAPAAVAAPAQALATAGAIAAVVALRRAAAPVREAGAVVAMTLANPYLHFYDLVVLSIPIWTLVDARRRAGAPIVPVIALVGAVGWGCRASGALLGVQPYPLVAAGLLLGLFVQLRAPAPRPRAS